MGALVKASLSALKSETAEICPVDLDLDQASKTYTGDYAFNFINALSGAQSFKNLNFSNFYLTDEMLLDDVTTFTGSRIIPKSIFSPLNVSTDGPGYVYFAPADPRNFEAGEDVYNADFYGYPKITTNIGDASYFEIEILDGFQCRVKYLVDNYVYYLVVGDETSPSYEREVLFVGENKLSLAGATLEYSIAKYKQSNYLTLFTTKDDVKYLIQSNGVTLIADSLNFPGRTIDNADAFFYTPRGIKLGGEIDLNIPSPYNTSFITYNETGNKINTDKSDFYLPSNYLFHNSSNSTKQVFDFLNLKNISNNLDEFVSSNNLLSSDETNPLYVKKLRKYTSIFSDIDSERNEALSLNYVYNNFNIKIPPGTTFFNTPSSLNPFTQININHTKFVDSGSFCFTQPYLADRVYSLDDEGVKSENATYLCTWLSGGIGTKGVWVDRYFYPDLTSKEEALSSKGTYNVTYNNLVENLIKSNLAIKTDVTKNYFFDKRSDLIFEPDKRYKYQRIKKEDLERKTPTNFCGSLKLRELVSNYFKTINENGGFALGFNLKSNSDNFTIRSRRNDIDGGFNLVKTRTNIRFTFSIFDNSSNITTYFSKTININHYVDNNIFFSFNAKRGICSFYLNSEVVFSFRVNAYQMFTKNILFGDIEILDGEGEPADILRNDITDKKYIESLYLTLAPLTEEEEVAAVFNLDFNEIQDITISLPCGMRNLTDTIQTVNSIGTNLKNKSNVVDINIKNLNIDDNNLTEELKNIILTNITSAIPKTTTINNINFVNYK